MGTMPPEGAQPRAATRPAEDQAAPQPRPYQIPGQTPDEAPTSAPPSTTPAPICTAASEAVVERKAKVAAGHEVVGDAS